MSASAASLAREFLRPELPILPGRYPNRPGPVHILNNLVYQALGAGGYGKPLAELISEGTGLAGLLSEPHNAGEFESTRRMLRAVFDSDGNVYKEFFSALPVSAAFAASDVTDDGYARALWNSIGEANRTRLTELLRELLAESASGDVVSGLSELVVDGLSRGATSEPVVVGGGGTPFGEAVGGVLCDGLEASRSKFHSASRLEVIRRLAVMASAFVVLGILSEPSTNSAYSVGAGESRSPSPGSSLGVLVYTGPTPGSSRDPVVGLAVRSLDDAVNRAHDGYVQTFAATLGALMDATGRRSRDDRLADALASRLSSKSLTDFLAFCRKYDGASDPANVAINAIDISRVRLGVKSLGYKVGISAPQRYGEHRLVLETHFLTALSSFIGHEDMTLQNFVDTIYETLGLIVGRPQQLGGATYDRLSDAAGRAFDVDQTLADAHEYFRQRLVRSGLAREYSDGLTVLGAL